MILLRQHQNRKNQNRSHWNNPKTVAFGKGTPKFQRASIPYRASNPDPFRHLEVQPSFLQQHANDSINKIPQGHWKTQSTKFQISCLAFFRQYRNQTKFLFSASKFGNLSMAVNKTKYMSVLHMKEILFKIELQYATYIFYKEKLKKSLKLFSIRLQLWYFHSLGKASRR